MRIYINLDADREIYSLENLLTSKEYLQLSNKHKQLYRSVYQDVPKDYYTIPFGKAAVLKEGNEVTIISFGAGVHWALETLKNNPEISADLIDLRSLQPLDW